MTFCWTCETEKPPADFYPAVRKHCKPCWRAKVKANRLANHEHYLAHDRARSNRPDRVAMREAYAETPEGRQAHKRAKRRWQDRNPEKRAAHNALNNAVRDGKIAKPDRCSRCGASGRIQAHHPNYALPLVVDWLCAPCHKAEHKEDADGLR